LDQRLLKLRSDMEPCKFFVKVLSAEQKSAVQQLLADDLADLAATLRGDIGRALLRDLLERNVVGVRNFCLIRGVSDEGVPEIVRYDVEIGKQVHEDIREAMLADNTLAINLFLFLLTAGTLTDTEKKP
jgi:hypothetical protein